MPGTRLLLVTGEAMDVTGTIDEVAKQVEDASRSRSGALAWFELSNGERVGVNPAHVVTIQREQK